jgi:hypothetical protein
MLVLQKINKNNYFQSEDLTSINISPLDQFEIRDLISLYGPILGNINISFTNIAMYLLIASYICFNFTILATNIQKLISNS